MNTGKAPFRESFMDFYNDLTLFITNYSNSDKEPLQKYLDLRDELEEICLILDENEDDAQSLFQNMACSRYDTFKQYQQNTDPTMIKSASFSMETTKVMRSKRGITKCPYCNIPLIYFADGSYGCNNCNFEAPKAYNTPNTKLNINNTKHIIKQLDSLCGQKKIPIAINKIIKYIEVWLTDLNYLYDWLVYSNTLNDFRIMYQQLMEVIIDQSWFNRKLERVHSNRWSFKVYKIIMDEFYKMSEFARRLMNSGSSSVCSMKLEDQKLIIDSWLKDNSEIPSGTDTVTLKTDTGNIEYNIGIKANNMKVLNTTERDNSMFYGSIFATGTGVIQGDKAGVKMDFVARSDDNSKFYMPLTDNSEISTADFVTFVTKSADTTSYLMRKKMMFENRRNRRMSSSSTMDITMALDVRPNAEVQLVIDPTVGDIIKGSGEGLLNLRINPQANIFEMYGDYTITKGSYLFTLQNVFNKWFDIEPGSTIQWTGDPFDALLNIDAVYRLKASLQPLLQGSLTQSSRSRAVPVECFIHLTDRLMQPTVTFDIVVPSADSDVQNIIASALATPESKSQQFLYLILANSFVSETSNAMTTSMGASATAATGFEMLSNQFTNWLSNDDYKIVLRYRPRTEQMSDEVDFGFSKGLVNNRLLIEVEGNYIVDKAQVVNANSNFTGEAYLTWLIDRAGVLRLKGFTHTIDRFDENQGLQETGIGIYFKEEFNNAKDLRMRLKNRFKREKKVDDAKAKDSLSTNKSDRRKNRSERRAK